MSPILISLAVFVGVAALVMGLSSLMRGSEGSQAESRLQMLTTASSAAQYKDARASILQQPLDAMPGMVEEFLSRFMNPRMLFEQANVDMSLTKFLAICGMLASGGFALAAIGKISWGVAPLLAITLGSFPLAWILLRRKRRLKQFSVQLPDALELVGRALRAGHSLAAGFDLVSKEMAAPIGPEFGRVFEEQNLGISMEEALESLTDRVPNLDLKFFATAVVLQRQTGGDLAEILDKIGRLVRERFRIWGQVQALTGEGRLSGIVLLALPPVLFLVVYKLNPEYIMLLFRDPMGKKMLAGALLMQVLGALAIRKIVNIKV